MYLRSPKTGVLLGVQPAQGIHVTTSSLTVLPLSCVGDTLTPPKCPDLMAFGGNHALLGSRLVEHDECASPMDCIVLPVVLVVASVVADQAAYLSLIFC